MNKLLQKTQLLISLLRPDFTLILNFKLNGKMMVGFFVSKFISWVKVDYMKYDMVLK
jgi:hypothetical protein